MTLRAYRAPRVVMTYHLSHSRVTPGQQPDGSDPHDGPVSQRIALLAAPSAGPSGGPKATGAVTAEPVTWRATRRSLEAMLTGAGLLGWVSALAGAGADLDGESECACKRGRPR